MSLIGKLERMFQSDIYMKSLGTIKKSNMEDLKLELSIPYYIDEDTGEKVFDWEGMAETIAMEIQDQTDIMVDIEIVEH